MDCAALVAYPDVRILEQVSNALTRWGCLVRASHDGEEALAYALAVSPQLFICGDSFPEISGAYVCQEVKKQVPQTRVVLLRAVAGGQRDPAAAGEGEGAWDATLTLPLQGLKLGELLREWGLLDSEAGLETQDPADLDASLRAPPELVLPGEWAHGPEGEAEAGEEADAPRTAASADSESGTGEASPLLESLPSVGDLEEVPLPRLLYLLYMESFTGVVLLRRLGLNKSIHLLEGLPARVDSDQIAQNLGNVLVAQGRIQEADYDRAQELVSRCGVRQGEALCWLGLIDAGDVHGALKEQTALKVNNAFAWRDGSYEIRSQTDCRASPLTSPIHPLVAIWRGVQEHYDYDSLMAYYFSHALMDRYIAATYLYGVHWETLGTLLVQSEIVPLLNGRTTFGEALQLSDADASEDPRAAIVARALYVLLATEMVTPNDEPGQAAEKPFNPLLEEDETDASTGLLGDDDPDPALAALREMLSAGLRIARAGDPHLLLGVSAEASPRQVEEACEALSGRLAPDRLPPGLDEDDSRKAGQLREVLQAARKWLLGPDGLSTPGCDTDADDAPMPDAAPDTRTVPDSVARGISAEKAYKAGLRLLKEGDVPEAEASLRKAVALSGNEPLYHVGLGMALLLGEQDDTEKGWRLAGAEFLNALRLDPACGEANLAMARMLFETEHRLSSRPYLVRVLQQAPDSKVARQMLEALDDEG